MTKVYLVYGSTSGSEKKGSWLAGVFLDEEKAKKRKDFLNEKTLKLNKDIVKDLYAFAGFHESKQKFALEAWKIDPAIPASLAGESYRYHIDEFIQEEEV